MTMARTKKKQWSRVNDADKMAPSHWCMEKILWLIGCRFGSHRFGADYRVERVCKWKGNLKLLGPYKVKGLSTYRIFMTFFMRWGFIKIIQSGKSKQLLDPYKTPGKRHVYHQHCHILEFLGVKTHMWYDIWRQRKGEVVRSTLQVLILFLLCRP